MEQIVKMIAELLKKYHKLNCANFSDLNDDMDDLRGHMLSIENQLDDIKDLCMLSIENQLDDIKDLLQDKND